MQRAEARAAGRRVEREKAGLPPPRPDDERVKDRLNNGRRPADIWLASWGAAGAAAVDFAVTSGLRDDLVNEARQDPAAVWGCYEDLKRSYKDTAAECQRQGLTFLPFVVEAHGGGFGPMARRVVAHIAKAGAATEGEEVERQAANTVRRMSCSVHRENARAVLRRFPAPPTGFAASGPEAWAEDVVWQ